VIKRGCAFILFMAAALYLAPPLRLASAHNTEDESPACYMGPHSDVICPMDPNHPDDTGPRDPNNINNPPWSPPSLPPAGPIPGLGNCEGQNPLDVFREHAHAREGFSLRVYADSLGNPTVGIGHLVVPEDHLKIGDVITEDRAMAFWEKDSSSAFNAALKQAKEAGICDPCFIAALASVDYQLGTGWRTKFPTVWALIAAGRYDEAATMLDDSLWMQQTPVRVRDFQMALRALPPKPPSCSITSGVPGHPVDPAPACSTIGWLSGGYRAGPTFEALRPNNPAKSNICTVFVWAKPDWAGLVDSAASGSKEGLDSGCANLIVSFRTLPGSFSSDSCPDNYRRIADGEFDDYYIAMATKLKNAGVPANAVFRIGWELNSDFPWGLLGCRTAEDAQTYIAGHRHIVDLLRMYFGDQFTVSWNFLKGASNLALPIDNYYPGDDYVDNVNVDYYDSWPGWTSVEEFNAYANQGSISVPLGINTWLAYAQSKGKKIGFDEWSILDAEHHGHDDNPAYIQAMYEWFQTHSCQLAYESYFNGHTWGHTLGGGEHPASSAMYASLWGRSETTELQPPCSCTPITTAPPPTTRVPLNPDAIGEPWLGSTTVTTLFESVTGVPTRLWEVFVGRHEGWAPAEGTKYWPPETVGLDPKRRVIISYPLIPQSEGKSLDRCAAGQYNHHYATLARNLKARGVVSLIIRVGWEFPMDSYAWCTSNDPQKNRWYAQCFRNFVNTVDSVYPENKFLYDWNLQARSLDRPATLEEAWPGDQYVDIVGQDVYDAYYGPSSCARDPICRFKRQLALLNQAKDFAIKHGKGISIPEWGVWENKPGDNRGAGDNPEYIRQMCEWISDPANRVIYYSYFNRDADGDSRLFIPQHSKSLAAFRKYCKGNPGDPHSIGR
jgi:GH24 family phage-related lysozyme (muramidase)